MLVIHDLHPADAAQLIKTPVAALVTGLGSATSHTAILARALEIPAVVGVADITARVGDGDELIVDAFGGEVVLEPDPAEIERARSRARRFRQFTLKLRQNAVSGSEDARWRRHRAHGQRRPAHGGGGGSKLYAQGIGLYRTEFLFLTRAEAPTEQEQYEVYSQIVRTTLPHRVTVRTIDMGGEALKGAFESRGAESGARAACDPSCTVAARAARRAAARGAARGSARSGAS